MEFLLLGAGALVLVGITLWIVWPARTADTVGLAARGEEVSEKPMAETVRPSLAIQVDRFADQYTTATEALQQPQVAPVQPPRVPSPLALAGTGLAESGPRSLAPQRNLGMGAGAVLVVSGGIGGAWLYARWQRERNRPINRLRRGARGMATRLGGSIPDVDELPYAAAPMSGAVTALLLIALVVTRALRREPVQALPEHPREARKPAIMGVGVGGMALVAGGAFAVWKLLRGGQPDRSTWYTGE
jgi:hypothetical protein